MANGKISKKNDEPKIVIKPIGRFGGLDGIHISLLILLVITLAFLLYISYARQSIVILTNQTQNSSSCSYGYVNGTCITPLHNATQIEKIFEQYLAGYSTATGQESLLPFIANISKIKAFYLSNSRSWLVTVAEKYLGSNNTFLFSAIINDSNTNQIIPSVQTIKPLNITNDSVAGYGYLKLSNKVSCTNSTTTPIYWFIDPYSPGSINSLYYLQNISKKFNKTVLTNIDILYTQYSQEIANSKGLTNATLLGKYLFCASEQSSFNTFASTLNSSYENTYMSSSLLSSIARNSGLNISKLSSCISSAGTTINRQAILAKYYNITSSPSVIIGCQYEALPQTAYTALCSLKNESC